MIIGVFIGLFFMQAFVDKIETRLKLNTTEDLCYVVIRKSLIKNEMQNIAQIVIKTYYELYKRKKECSITGCLNDIGYYRLKRKFFEITKKAKIKKKQNIETTHNFKNDKLTNIAESLKYNIDSIKEYLLKLKNFKEILRKKIEENKNILNKIKSSIKTVRFNLQVSFSEFVEKKSENIKEKFILNKPLKLSIEQITQRVFHRKFFNLSLYKQKINKSIKKNVDRKNISIQTLENITVINDNSSSVLIKDKYEFEDVDSKLSIMKGSKITYDLIRSVERINENNLNLCVQKDEFREEEKKGLFKKSSSFRNDDVQNQISPYYQTFS